MQIPTLIWRHIPIEFHVFDPDEWAIPPLCPGSINYAIPEPFATADDEYVLRDEIYTIIENSLLQGHPPAGVVRGTIKSVRFNKSIPRYLRDAMYPQGINPLARIPGHGVVVFGQMFITISGDIARIVPGENLIHPEFIALT